MDLNSEKFKSLVHYICWRCADPTKLGAVKLNKVLWRADFRAYLELGEPVTGATYVKRQYGPVPSAILPTLRRLEEEGKLSIRDVEYFDNQKREFFALTRPDISSFSPDEISLIDEAIQYVTEKHTARSISEESHDRIWELARIGEEIPYSTVFSKAAEITEDDIEWARMKIAELQD
jgi:hypothetical protein